MVKNPPAKQEMEVWSLSQEDPLKVEMATHSSIFAWETPWTEEPDGLQSMGLQKNKLSVGSWNVFGVLKFFNIILKYPYDLNYSRILSNE